MSKRTQRRARRGAYATTRRTFLATARLGFLPLFLLCVPAASVAGAPTTEVVVIGTVHSPTAHYRSDTLVRILDRAKPDLILFEVDTSFIDGSAKLKPQYRAMNLEAIAVAGTDAPLAPYDINGRNEFYQRTRFFERMQELSQALSGLARERRLVPEARALLDSITAYDRVRDAFLVDRAEVINTAACDSAMARKQAYAISGMKRIVELTPELRPFADFTTLRAEEWDRRHRAMIENIANQVRTHAGKRIVVLCGFEHRYALRGALAGRPGITLRE